MMLNITNYQGNANQNHNEVSLHSCQNGYCQKDNKLQMLVRIWRKGNQYPFGGNKNQCSQDGNSIK